MPIDCAFKDCKNLTQISIGCGLTELSNTIFVNCQKVKNLIIPNSTIDVYNNIFGYYTGYSVFYCGTYEEFLDKKYTSIIHISQILIIVSFIVKVSQIQMAIIGITIWIIKRL